MAPRPVLAYRLVVEPRSKLPYGLALASLAISNQEAAGIGNEDEAQDVTSGLFCPLPRRPYRENIKPKKDL
jgi:hypothetical protein